MYKESQRRDGMSQAILHLWQNWAIAVGLLTVLAILAPYEPRQWLVPVNVLFIIALQFYHSHIRRQPSPSCSRLAQQVSVVMIVTAIVLLLLYFFDYGGPTEITGQAVNLNSPILVILITAPVASIVTLCFLLQRKEPNVCRRCKMRYGNVIENGFVGEFFAREWRYQTRLLFFLSLGLSIADWTYYLVRYVNTNINRSDEFFFIWLPLLVYTISLLFLGRRYYSLWQHYCVDDALGIVKTPGNTTLRYLLISHDKMLIGVVQGKETFPNGSPIRRFDTPVTVTIPYRENEDLGDAVKQFISATGIKSAKIKLAYSSPDPVTFHNIFHYFAFIPSTDEILDSKIEGEWLSWENILMLGEQGLFTKALVSELDRIYRIAMAWKTYDKDGHRLYPIKNYRPTFHLRDIINWDVDFNNSHWLTIGRHNQDRFWFPFRQALKSVFQFITSSR